MLYKTLPNNERKLYWLLLGILLKGTLIDLANVLQMNILEPIINALCVLLFLIGLTELLKSVSKTILISTSIFAVLWLFSYWFYPQNRPHILDNYIQFFIFVLPFFWVGVYQIKNNIYLKLFLPIARIKLVLACLVQILIFINPSLDIFEGDYMNAANSLLVGLIAVYYLSFQERRISDIALSIVSTIILLLCGSRGVFVSILFFAFLYIASSAKKSHQVMLVGTFLILSFIDLKQLILLPIAELANQIGYSSHLIDAVVDFSVFEDESRTQLFEGFYKAIWKAPFGYGIMGDRQLAVVNNIWHKPMYPHNLYLEALINFGYTIGLLIAIIFTFKLFKSVFIIKNSSFRDTIIVLASCSFIKLLFSSSYWWDPIFFMLLGSMSMISYLNNHKRKFLLT